MKNKVYKTLLILTLICGLYRATINEQKTTITPSTTSGVILAVENMNHFKEESISNSEITVVGESESEAEMDRLEITGEVEVSSEPLVFPDSYFDPETETYREEDFWDDMELVALVCVAEAEGESEYGKRLVIDSVFNRVDSPYFPNTIREVIYARDQYESVWNGRVDVVEYDEYIANLVLEELNNRTNADVIYFKTGGYFGFGTPLLQEGNHYFSGR